METLAEVCGYSDTSRKSVPASECHCLLERLSNRPTLAVLQPVEQRPRGGEPARGEPEGHDARAHDEPAPHVADHSVTLRVDTNFYLALCYLLQITG